MGIPIYDTDYDDASTTTTDDTTTTATDDSCCSNCFAYLTNQLSEKVMNSNAAHHQTQQNQAKQSPLKDQLNDQNRTQQQQQQQTHHQHQHQHQHRVKHEIKNLVGNGKEYRIDGVNKYDLYIIGNGNRVRITNNVGNVQIIGNATRLKINTNSGYIKYTGNDGRISLGTESTQQCVDYIGCNGILKICNSTDWSAAKKPKSSKSDTTKTAHNAIHRGCTKSHNCANGNTKKRSSSISASPAAAAATATASTTTPIPKSASYAGMNWSDQWTHIRTSKNMSMPNLGQKRNGCCGCYCYCCHNENARGYTPINVINKTIGSIVIQNAVNVTI